MRKQKEVERTGLDTTHRTLFKEQLSIPKAVQAGVFSLGCAEL